MLGLQVAREIRIMRQFDHPNIVKLIDIVPPLSTDFEDVYMVGELMDVDLHRAIYYGKKLTQEHIQFFMYQVSTTTPFPQTNKKNSITH